MSDIDPTSGSRSDEIVERIKPLLAGQGPIVQALVVGDLVAIWLVSHKVIDSAPDQRQLREDLLEKHIELVRELVSFYESEGV